MKASAARSRTLPSAEASPLFLHLCLFNAPENVFKDSFPSRGSVPLHPLILAPSLDPSVSLFDIPSIRLPIRYSDTKGALREFCVSKFLLVPRGRCPHESGNMLALA